MTYTDMIINVKVKSCIAPLRESVGGFRISKDPLISWNFVPCASTVNYFLPISNQAYPFASDGLKIEGENLDV